MTPRWPHVTSTWPRDALSELSGSDCGALSYPRLKGRRNESLTEDGFGAQDGLKLAPDGPKRPQGAQRKPQDGPKMAPRGAI